MNPGTPDSAAVGISGATAKRVRFVVASRRNLPARSARHERERIAKAEAEAAIAAKAERDRAQRERAHEIDRQSLFNLGVSAARQDAFQRNVENAHAQNVRQQYTTSLMDELNRAINELGPPTAPASGFSTLYRQNQRSGWYYVTPEDSDE